MFPWQTNSILVLSLFSDMLCINLLLWFTLWLTLFILPVSVVIQCKISVFFLHVTAENGKKESAQVGNGEFCVQEL